MPTKSSTKSTTKRVVVISDTHCGHMAGLTHPDYQRMKIIHPVDDIERRRNKFAELQKQIWKWYSEELQKIQPVDILFNLGDNIDGRDEKWGGTELLDPDQNVQCNMAVRAIQEAKAKKIFMLYGTPYHSSAGYSDWEDGIAESVGAEKIGSREFIDVNGVIFDLRHKMSKSNIPHGQTTLLAKQKLWNDMWALVDRQPNADIILRGHIHDFWFMGNERWLAMSLPGLEWSTKYGTRIADGMVNVGFVHFDIEDDGKYRWQYHKCNLGVLKAEAIKA